MPFLLDTCAVSEFIARKPDAKVLHKLRTLPAFETFLPVIVIGELVHGTERLPPSKRKDELDAWLREVLLPQYVGRILSVDADTATEWGRLTASLEASGFPADPADSLIAAIARIHRLTLVTRNETHFAHTGITILNPWRT